MEAFQVVGYTRVVRHHCWFSVYFKHVESEVQTLALRRAQYQTESLLICEVLLSAQVLND